MTDHFEELYDRWIGTGAGVNVEFEPALREAYRTAWKNEGLSSRRLVLTFIVLTKEPAVDVVLDALDDRALAVEAISAADTLLRHGISLGPDARERIEAFAAANPERSGIASDALEALRELEEAQ